MKKIGILTLCGNHNLGNKLQKLLSLSAPQAVYQFHQITNRDFGDVYSLLTTNIITTLSSGA